jgi:hypothetical protein
MIRKLKKDKNEREKAKKMHYDLEIEKMNKMKEEQQSQEFERF